MPISDSCLLLSPASDGAMAIEMGSRSDEPVKGSEAISQRSAPPPPIRETRMKSSIHVTDDSDRSDWGKRNESPESNESMQQSIAEEEETNETNGTNMMNGFRAPKRKLGAIETEGPILEAEEAGDGPDSVDTEKLTLPQHERIRHVEPLDISYTSTAASENLRSALIARLRDIYEFGRIQVIDLSRRGLTDKDAETVGIALRSNPQLAVMKLGYNCIGDRGAAIIAACSSREGRHHQSLTVLDLGFNCIGDEGCTAITLNMMAGNHTLRNLFLSGNVIKDGGAIATAGAILHGCSLTRLHLSANAIGYDGMKILSGAIGEMDKRRQQIVNRPGRVTTSVQPATLEELHFADINLNDEGIVALSSMLLSNTGLCVLDISNNRIDDKGLALLSQTLAQNKSIPLKSLSLAFNKITCAGVECLMNAIWGSKTLKELKLDNNKVQDRGAQLCSVVLGSVSLEKLDLSYNSISTVGIKALMKTLSENNSLKSLSLNGIPMDQNSSKAVSYALAYNASLEAFSIYSCCIGYTGQRHIAAGVVSNRNVNLRRLNGFTLGPITSTLGLPQLPEDWGNERVLGFVRFMWAHWSAQNPSSGPQGETRGPAPPTAVAAAGKKAFASLSESDEARMQCQQQQSLHIGESPIIDPDTAILVRSISGRNLQIPDWGDGEDFDKSDLDTESWSSETDSLDRSSFGGSSLGSQNNLLSGVNKERRNRNLQWLRGHSQALHDVGNIAFSQADLWFLHQHFFSPPYDQNDMIADSPEQKTENNKPKNSVRTRLPTTSSLVVVHHARNSGNGSTKPAKAKEFSNYLSTTAERPNKRISGEESSASAPSPKRARNSKPRIAYFPRVREKLESMGAKPSAQTLSLLRQLKYLEAKLFQGMNIYVDKENKEEQDESPSTSDAEMILLDLL